ncbi:MAG: coenzyme F420-0:L-glutamate ligase, partial [Oscillospiraceae bacterium]
YVTYYKELIKEMNCEAEIIFANDPKTILNYTKNVLFCDIHSRERTRRILKANGAEKLFGLTDILSKSVEGSGSNLKYGLLGSNKATETTVKLFPEDCTEFVNNLQKKLFDKTGKMIEVMVYGDGAFKDPVGQIWELADPVVSPGYTIGLEGKPNEVKLKYLADNQFAHLSGDELKQAISEYITNKADDLKGSMASQGTTPRRLTDLIGSLCDLTSGSGDKGTPVIIVQGYFDNFTK